MRCPERRRRSIPVDETDGLQVTALRLRSQLALTPLPYGYDVSAKGI